MRHGGEARVPPLGRQSKIFRPNKPLKRAAISPTGAQFMQLIFNFERVRNIDLRRGIFSRGHRVGTTRWPLLEIAGPDCHRWLRSSGCMDFALHASYPGRRTVFLDTKQAVRIRRKRYRWRADRKL